MDRIQNLQMSLFGNFFNIKPQTDIVIKLLTALQEDGFVPGSAEVASFDVTSGKLNVESRMQLVSPDKTWTIVFLAERIDFNYNYQLETKEYKYITELVEYGKSLIVKVFSNFANTIGNRLAVNCNLVLESMTPDDLKQFCDRFTKPIDTYKDDSYVEWGVRYNARSEFSVDNTTKEVCNRIIEMTQAEKIDESIQPPAISHDIFLMVDVNTLPNEVYPRFTYENLLVFSDDAIGFIQAVIKEIEGN